MQQQQQTLKPPYLIYVTRDHFYLSCRLEHLPESQYIRIERETCKVENMQEEQFYKQVMQVKPFYAYMIIGILILNSEIYLLYVQKVSMAFPYPKSDEIYQVENVIHLPFRSSIDYKYSKNKKNNEEILKFLEETIMKKNYYFRFRSDITLSMENIKLYAKSTQPKFFWNQHLVRIFKQNNAHKCWRIPLMQGFVKYEKFANDSYYLMIARRSKILSGPKLLNRGIWQSDGQSVANFVETQEVYKIKNDTLSYVSVRGSAPVYWKQSKGYIQCRNDDKNPIGFHSHLQSLQKAYPDKRIYFISWLMREKQQILLKQKFDICFYHSKHKYHENDKYRMISIDIDQNNKNAIYFLKQLIHHQVSLLMPYRDNFFWVTEENGQQIVMGKQKLLYRVSDLDCTQRTNAIMIELSKKILRDVQDILSIKYNNKAEYFEGLEDVVIPKWKQLGNRISKLYLGQEQFEVGKKQQGGFFSMFNMNKDPQGPDFKQRTLQLFLNEITPKQVMWIQKNLQRKLAITEKCSINSLKFFILSWNCNNLNPLSINQLSKEMLFKFNRGKVDVVVFNLQQMVQLSTYNVLVTIDEQVKSRWKEIINETLNEKITSPEEKFDFVAQENLVAITTWVFVKNKVKVKYFEGKQSTIVKTGFANGLGGNKGGVIIFLKFDSTWISLVNCHLTAGEGKKSQRKQSLQQILYGWLQERYRDRMNDCDITFLIGDLNFRLEWTQEEIKTILYDVKKKFNKESLKMGLSQNVDSQGIIESLKVLWEKDQLFNYKKDSNDFISKFVQKPLTFMPTYKFIKKTHIDEYDDKRSPAWCDRILYEQKIQSLVNQIIYQDIDINLSDHKPVCALFQVKIKKIQNKQDYMKKFEQQKKIYYANKSNVKKISVTQQINPKSNEKKNSLYSSSPLQNIDFFKEKQVQTSKQDLLIDLDFSQSKNSTKSIKKLQPKNQTLVELTTYNKEENQRKSQNSPTKHDFAQFHDIANELQKKNSKKSDDKDKNNLLDLV